MPWKIAKNDSGKWCVHKEAPDGGIGEQVACHGSEAEAKQQMAALYAQEPAARAIRMVDGSDDLIEGLGIPFGGPWAGGNDLYGEHFSIKTDLAPSWFPGGRPLLYHHGLDADAGISAVGRQTTYEIRADLGVWTRGQLDKSSEYFSAIKDLVKAGKLFFSSGAMAHLVDVDKRSGEIRRWPWVELSLTPTPANLLATVDFATARAHIKAAGLELPDGLKAVSMAMMRQMASEMDMEMSDAEMQAMVAAHPDADEAEMRQLMRRRKPAKAAPSFSDVVSFLLDDPGLDVEPVPVGFHAEAVTHLAASLAERTKGLHQRRLKEGRMISDSNRKRLMGCMEQMGAAMKEMQTLLDSSMPAPKSTEGRTVDMAVLRRQADSLRLFAATLPQN